MKEYIIYGVCIFFGVLILIYFLVWLILYLKVRSSFKKLDVFLKRRSELSKTYMVMIYDSFLQEQAALIAVNDINGKLGSIVDHHEYFELNSRLSDEYRRIFASIPNYPELRNKENFDNIHSELTTLENSIDVSRKVYNNKTKNYNFRMGKFPFKIFGVKEKPLYITKYDRFNDN